VQHFLPLVLLLLCALLLTVVSLLCTELLSYVYFCHLMCIVLLCVCIAVLRVQALVIGLLTRSQYPEGPATGNLGTGFSWFPCVYKRMLRWFPRLQVATACFSCSPPDLNFLHSYFIFMYMHYNHCHQATDHLQLIIIIIIIIYIYHTQKVFTISSPSV
jgi:hypothetical protein